MTNETLQTIRSRRSCRAYEPRQITDADLVAGASIKGMPDYIAAVAERDRNVSF